MLHSLRYLLYKTTHNTRIETIKFKINGRCVNKCSFCPFHSDPNLLEVRDIAHFFDLAGTKRPFNLVVNGGEPTLHPQFFDICSYLKEQHRGRMLLSLGTNLIPFSWTRGRYAGLRMAVYDTFHRIEVGCDDEHRNIEHLERFAPEIVESGIILDINVMADFCSEVTKRRILALKERYGLMVTFSDVHHFYESRPTINDTSRPCKNLAHELMINCNGDAFFCFHQEMEKSLFNLNTVTREDLLFYLEEHDPQMYRFCACCPRYVPERSLLIRNNLKSNAEKIKKGFHLKRV